ncbi:MAG TPA: hypothetical protein VFS52_07005 [Steroidobacteraceae bacterium]|nr:hypothetical protein [Steroidobacteraceae bacterium]
MRFALLGMLAIAPVHAAESEAARRDARFEIIPYLGFRDGGSFKIEGSDQSANVDGHASFAIAFNLVLPAEELRYHFYYSRQETEVESSPLNIEYLHLGGTMTPDPSLALMPYVIGSMGVTRFAPRGAGLSDETRFSLGLGGGLRIPTRTRVEVLLEARGFLTVISASTSFFCSSGATGGVCALRGHGSSFWQYELLAGASFAF